MAFNDILVIGAGAWGTALALTCARAGRTVSLWEPEAANAAQLATKRESPFLPGVRLDEAITLAAGLADVARAQAILLVVPAQAVRAVMKSLAASIAAGVRRKSTMTILLPRPFILTKSRFASAPMIKPKS